MRIIKRFNNIILVKLLLGGILIISVFYIYLLSNTIQAAVESKNNLKNIQVVSREYQGLEDQYFSLLSKINIDYAREIGFVEQPQKVDYIVRQTAVAYGKGF